MTDSSKGPEWQSVSQSVKWSNKYNTVLVLGLLQTKDWTQLPTWKDWQLSRPFFFQ